MRCASALAAAALVLAGACGSDGESLAPPDERATVVAVTTAGPTSLRVAFAVPQGLGSLRGFRLERRQDFDGPFAPVGDLVAPVGDSVLVLDAGLAPETYYGYRYRAVTLTGESSGPSLVGGGRTAPPPGLFVVTSTVGGAGDADGYQVAIDGPELRNATIGAAGGVRFAPLPLGEYRVALRGLATGCAVEGDTARTARVAVQGARTIDTLTYAVRCRDATRGGVVLRWSGDGPQAPAAAQFRVDAVIGGVPVVRDVSAPRGVDVVVDGLQPGGYDVELRGLPAGCEVEGAAKRSVDIVALGLDSLAFRVRCGGDEPGGSCTAVPPPDPSRPYKITNAWSAPTAAPGSTVTLTIELDLRGGAAPAFGGLQYRLGFDGSRLEFLDAEPIRQGLNLTVGPPEPGGRLLVGFYAGSDFTGLVPFVRARFRVRPDASAGCVATRTLTDASVPGEFLSSALEDLLPLTEPREAQLEIGGTGGGNLPPSADPGGPYTATAGVPVTLDGRASSDSDGSIAGYAWSFGDGTTGSGAQPVKAWAQAGSYAVTLTVTDDDGATASASTIATVTAGGSGTNQPPIARAGGPYTGTAGQPITFSGAASSDPDGTIVAYAWAFGDGTTATGASPTKSYAAAGTYTATLTVTDDRGATGSASVTVTVSPAGSPAQPLVLRNVFQAGAVAGTIDLLVYLDLTADLPQTAGPETLQAWAISLLQWNERVLRYRSFNTGSGWGAVFPQLSGTDPVSGLRSLSIPLTQYQGSGANRSGLVLLARIGFDVVGAPGTSTTTLTAPGALLGEGSFSYGPFTQVQEATYSRP